jgi:hypothetical protein
MHRVALGFLLCALGYPLVVLASGVPGAEGGAGFVAVFTVGASMLGGLPLWAWFQRNGWFKLWQSLVAGFAIGVLASFPFAFAGNAYTALFFAATFALIGGAHALLFWLGAICRNAELQVRPGRASSVPPGR